jgi:hypothetical protein
VRGLHGLGVEVEDDLHVVADEADRRHDDAGAAARGQVLEVVVDVRLQPRLLRRPGTGAVDEVPLDDAAAALRDAVGDGLADGPVHRRVGAAAGPGGLVHRDGDGVRDENHTPEPAVRALQLGQRLVDGIDVRLDEAGMVRVVPHLVDRELATLGGEPLDRRRQVFPVLPAAGVARVGAGDDRQHPPGAFLVRVAQGVRDVRRPVAVAPHDRRRDTARRQLGPQRREQRAVLVVDRAAAAELPVVLGDLGQPLARDPAPPGDVLEEREHLVRPLGTAEGEQQDRVVGGEPGLPAGRGLALGHGVGRRHTTMVPSSGAGCSIGLPRRTFHPPVFGCRHARRHASSTGHEMAQSCPRMLPEGK